MNVPTLISFLIAIAVFAFSILGATDNPRNFIDVHGIVIVIAGTIACTAISFQIDRVYAMTKVFFRGVLKRRKIDYKQTVADLMKLAEAYRINNPDLPKMVAALRDPFMREAMLILMDGVIEPANIKRVLMNRVITINGRYTSDARVFQGMGKFPPAMGLMGAVLGMIALLGSLGKPGAEKTVGPSMSIALIATFYGIAFANLLIIPIGENLADSVKELTVKNTIIVEGVVLISKKRNPVTLAEELNSFLLPGERVDRKTILAAAKK